MRVKYKTKKIRLTLQLWLHEIFVVHVLIDTFKFYHFVDESKFWGRGSNTWNIILTLHVIFLLKQTEDECMDRFILMWNKNAQHSFFHYAKMRPSWLIFFLENSKSVILIIYKVYLFTITWSSIWMTLIIIRNINSRFALESISTCIYNFLKVEHH